MVLSVVLFLFLDAEQFFADIYQTEFENRRYRMLKQNRFTCPNCHCSYKVLKYLNYHLRYECGRKARFHCPYCNYTAKFSSNARIHVKTKHPDYQLYLIDMVKNSASTIL